MSAALQPSSDDSPANRANPAVHSFFRREIMEAQQNQWLGTVLLEPRLSQRMFVGFATSAAIAVVCLMIFGTYTRKERVNGWLVPRAGVVRIVSPQPGTITEIKISDGAAVDAGTPLLVISGEFQSRSGPVREEVLRTLHQRLDSLNAEKAEQDKLYKQQVEDLRVSLDATQSQINHISQEIALQLDRFRLSERRLSRMEALRAKGLVTELQTENADQDRLDQAGRRQALERDRAELQKNLAELTGNLNQLPYQQFTKIAESDRNISAIEQQLTEAEAQREVIITAPQPGVVTNLQAAIGSNVQQDVPLMNVVPSGSSLRAELFGTSLSIGFIRPGQKVKLRYDAFPYQKFGFQEGVVASVSRAAISPSDLPRELANLSTLYDATKPIYRITVDLSKQSATAYGATIPLQSGMQLSGDILIDRRTLIEWIFDPIYSLTGSWQ
jgi:membrane fusion protein